jgi:hypothetical protein
MKGDNNQQSSNNFYNSTRDWIEESILDRNLIHNLYREFYSDETVHLPPAKGIAPPQWGLEHRFVRPFVATIENGNVFSNKEGMLFVMAPNRKLLRDMVLFQFWNSFKSEAAPPITHREETVAVLAWAGAWTGENNYYHWLHDTLGRLHLLALSGITVDKYVFPKLRFHYQYETLNKIGIPPEKIIQINSDKFHLKAKKLILASIPSYLGGGCVKWACDFVRSTFLDTAPIRKMQEFDRIYISRQDANSRKVINEDEVMNVLSKKGFKKVVLSTLSVQKQRDIFNSAKYIISPYGANLTNIVFCDPGTKIIQLYIETAHYTGEFARISHYMNLDFYFIKCQVEGLHENPLFNNIQVDIKNLLSIIQLTGM